MHVVEIFLPLADNEGMRFTEHAFNEEKATLVERFGGVTIYSRAPVKGLWAQSGQSAEDDLVIFEIMTADLAGTWWEFYRQHLEAKFRQASVLIRARAVTLL
jgi:hypothetical protein